MGRDGKVVRKDVSVRVDVSIREEGAIQVMEVSSPETEMSLVEILKSSKGLDVSKISHIY